MDNINFLFLPESGLGSYGVKCIELFIYTALQAVTRKGECSQLGSDFHGHNTYCEETAVAQWLMCCATNPKVDGSIPGGVSGVFH